MRDVNDYSTFFFDRSQQEKSLPIFLINFIPVPQARGPFIKLFYLTKIIQQNYGIIGKFDTCRKKKRSKE